MSALQVRSSGALMGRDGRRGPGEMRAHRIVHRVMMMQRRRLRGLRRPRIESAPFRTSHDASGTALVVWMVEQSADVVHKERVEKMGDLLSIRKVKRTLKGNPRRTSAQPNPTVRLNVTPPPPHVRQVPSKNRAYVPDALEMHRADLDDVPQFLALENAISSTSGHASDIQELRAVDHMIIFSRSVSG